MTTSYAQAVAVRQLSSHQYEALFPTDWVIGSVPHGGFVTACFLSVAEQHFCTTLSRQSQPHTISLRLDFLRRTETGPAVFTVRDVKLGRATSTVHITLAQHGRDEVVGYLTNSNLSIDMGLSIDTGWHLDRICPVDLIALDKNNDARWQECKAMPYRDFRNAASKVRLFIPRGGQAKHPAYVDQWMRCTDRTNFTNSSLGYVADTFAQIIEVLTHDLDPYYDTTAATTLGAWWYPTLSMSLDIKKALPEHGAEWLFVRAAAKQIKNGRYDLEVIVLDQNGELVAISNHVCMVLSAQRNLAERSSTGSRNDSKL